jgi:hypothetical protein
MSAGLCAACARPRDTRNRFGIGTCCTADVEYGDEGIRNVSYDPLLPEGPQEYEHIKFGAGDPTT